MESLLLPRVFSSAASQPECSALHSSSWTVLCSLDKACCPGPLCDHGGFNRCKQGSTKAVFGLTLCTAVCSSIEISLLLLFKTGLELLENAQCMLLARLSLSTFWHVLSKCSNQKKTLVGAMCKASKNSSIKTTKNPKKDVLRKAWSKQPAKLIATGYRFLSTNPSITFAVIFSLECWELTVFPIDFH